MFPGGWGYRISRQSAHEGGKVVSPKPRPPLPPSKKSWYLFLLEAELTPGPWFGRIPMTLSGIEPASCRLVAQYLKQLRHRNAIIENFNNYKLPAIFSRRLQMTIVLFCYHGLNYSTSHTQHKSLPEYGLHNAKPRTNVTTDITPRSTWKVQPFFSSSWWQPFCSYWVSRNKKWH